MNVGEAGRRGAVVALKPIEQAKSRLRTVPGLLRQQLALAMAVDTLAALSQAVDEVLVVSGQRSLGTELAEAGLDVEVVTEPGPLGLNGALSFGAEVLQSSGCHLVLACVADLPALRTESVRRVLAAAADHQRCYLGDASGVGTTMLLARGARLDPRFQGASAAAHSACGAVVLTDDLLGAAVPDARQDVDTEADLRAATALGLGPATAALLHGSRGAA